LAGEAGRGGVAVLGARPELPFVLQSLPIGLADPRIDAILHKLDSLLDSLSSSRLEMESLRQISLQVLQAVKSARAERAVPHDAPETEAAVSSLPLQLRLLGPFEARVNDVAIRDWPSKKARLLLAYLALERGRMVPKDALIELFWPDTRLERGSNNLSIAVHQLRSMLARIDARLAQAMIVRQGLYGLDHSIVHADVWDLRASLAEARPYLERQDTDAARVRLVRAVSLCPGELLESDLYEDWLVEPRRWLSAAYLQALAWLASEASQRSDWASVLDFAARIVQRERCDEPAHRWLMQAHARMGNRSQALHQYQVCVENLMSDLGVDPTEETRRAYARIRDGLI
jgi:LuxR family maltose regulon positive regulatory protein